MASVEQAAGPARGLAWVRQDPALSAAPGNMLAMEGVVRWLELNGFIRAPTVREAGDYAVRGGILDLFSPLHPAPVRVELWDDRILSLRSFDPATQRSTGPAGRAVVLPVAEFRRGPASAARGLAALKQSIKNPVDLVSLRG